MRKPPPVRYIKPEQICIGDAIKVEWEDEDVTCSTIGIVARRDHQRNLTAYDSAKGRNIITVFGDGTMFPNIKHIILLHREEESTLQQLEGLEL